MAERTILVVDDEERITNVVRWYLEDAGYGVQVAHDGLEALARFNEGDFALVILDLMLPKLDGLEVCRQIRKRSMVPILMLTARDAESDRILGFELGADDYLTKPFSNRELVLRVNAILRRASLGPEGSTEGVIRHGDLIIDVPRHEVTVRGQRVALTAMQFQLLKLLASHPGRVFSREELIDRIWESHYGELRIVDVHICNLREKIETHPGQPEYIQTVWGVGYRFCSPARGS
jgi:DNA-binding response OmpR family regulator